MASEVPDGLTRRRLVTLTGSGLLTVFAGCSSSSDSDEPEDQTSVEDTSESTTSENGSDERGQSRGTDQGTVPEQEYDTPEKAVAAFIRAMYLPDIESANELLHSDSPVSEVSALDVRLGEVREGGTELAVEIQETTVQEETETTASVGVDRAISADGEVVVSGVTTFGVQKEGEEWKLIIEEEDLPI